jgi:hypothetical protein
MGLITPIDHDSGKIESVIAKLQNNKAAGIDNITNEYIKFTLHIMLPIYTTICNLVSFPLLGASINNLPKNVRVIFRRVSNIFGDFVLIIHGRY